MFEKILFATTASPTCDDAAKVAFELSKKNKSQLHVLHVFAVPTRAFGPFVKDVRTGDEETVDENYLALVREEIKNTYEKLMPGLENLTIEAVVGNPPREILRKAREQGSDLIIMGAHTRDEDVGATRHRAIAGSTMQKVAKAARCPVLIVSRPCVTCWSYFANIVVGTDFSKPADHAFQFALNVAKELGCRLHLFHAADVTKDNAGLPPGQCDIECAVDNAKKKMEEKYVSKMGDFDNYVVESWEGVPYVEILKYAREHKADLVVMAHHARDVNPEESSLGGTIEQVVLRSACPVLSVNHPDKVAVEPYGPKDRIKE